MNTDKSELRWSVEQRLEFIGFWLFWEGTFNRSELMNQFGISVNQASTNVPSARFKPVFDKLGSIRYLAQLLTIQNNILNRNGIWIAEVSDFGAAPIPGREVYPL